MTGLVVDAFASHRHYLHHLLPVWEALPAEARGVFWGGPDDPGHGRARTPGPPVLVAGLVDAQAVPDRKLILVEHGAGQSYPGDRDSATSGSYSGGDGWDRALGFLCPSVAVADRWRARYDVPAFVVGPVGLDRWHGFEPPDRIHRGTVAFTWHWDCTLIPETRSAWTHYAEHIGEIVTQLRDWYGWRVIAHHHPRWSGALDHRWRSLGVDVVSYDDLMATADVLVADNTSALYEFAATGRPVVALNCPSYRRDIEHGLRFWSHVPGIQVDDPADVAYAVAIADVDDELHRAIRIRAVTEAYSVLDGHAAHRAALASLLLAAGDR